MAKTDQYDRMNTAQLEAEATSRGLNLDEFQSLGNNAERAQRLRDHDAQTDATNEQAAENARQAAQRQQDQQQAQQQTQDQGADQGQGTDSLQVSHGGHAGPYDDPQATDQGGRTTGEGVTERLAAEPDRTPTPRDVGDYDVAPYPTQQDAQNRIDAAAGQVQTTQSIDTGDAGQVGGLNRPTENGRDPDLNPDR